MRHPMMRDPESTASATTDCDRYFDKNFSPSDLQLVQCERTTLFQYILCRHLSMFCNCSIFTTTSEKPEVLSEQSSRREKMLLDRLKSRIIIRKNRKEQKITQIMLIYSNYKCDIDIELCDKDLQFIDLKVNYYITIYFSPQFYKYVFTCDTIQQ